MGLWKTLVALAYILFVSSTQYMFSAYSVHLGETLHLRTTELNFIAFTANLGTWAGIISGFLADRFGAKITAMCGGVLSLVGYMCFSAAVGGVVCGSVTCMSVYAFLWAQGNNWTYFAAMKQQMLVVNRADTALTMGILVSLYSLAAGVFAQIYRGWFLPSGNLGGFFALVGVMSFACATGGAMLALRDAVPAPPMTPIERMHLIKYAVGYVVMLITAVTICAVVSIDVEGGPSGALMAGVVCVLMAGIAGGLTQETSLSSMSVNDDALEEVDGAAERTLLEALKTPEYWLCLLVLMTGVGSGVVLLNNVGTIVAAFHQDTSQNLKRTSASAVTLFAVCNALGRLGFGTVSASYDKWPRWYFLCLASALMVAGHVISLACTIDSMYISICFVGIGYGALFCMEPTLVRDLFGRASFGATWGVMGLAPAIPSLTVATLFAGHVAETEMEASSYTVQNGKRYCLGAACYRPTFLLNVGMSSCGLIAAIILARRIDRQKAQNAN